MVALQPTDALEPVRVPPPFHTQPGDASWRNDFASRPISHGVRHPASAQQVTAASAQALSQQRAALRWEHPVRHEGIPVMLVPIQRPPAAVRGEAHHR